MDRVNLVEAKAHLSALVNRAAKGEEIEILRHGKPVAKLSPPTVRKSRKPFDWDELERVTATMTPQTESAGELMRKLREDGY